MMSASLNVFDAWFSEQRSRIGSLALIVLAHIGVFYALLSGLEHKPVAHAPPREVFATFITPEPARAPAQPKPKPEPVKPKTIQPKPAPAVPKPIPRERPVQRAEETAPSPTAISAPQPAPAAVEPPAPAAAAPVAPAAPVVPAPAAPPQPKTVTSGIEYIQPPRPDYPPASRRSGEEGRAVLRVLVNEHGRPQRIEVQKSSGYERLDEAARQAASRAVFKPFMEDGKAVAAYAIVPVNFQLD
ncbi:MAG: TonB family protein [Noviherbaspirillum sp.]|nr:TonB family protein [Noviherbaspirillum sp.]